MAAVLIPLLLDSPGSRMAARRLPPVPWRDPHTVKPAELRNYIQVLEQACLDNPLSADLRTCLGMAHAMNYDVYKSMDALDEAVKLEPDNFWAQMKKSELNYRLRALEVAEEETVKALDLAMNAFEANLARKQLQEVRRLRREGTQKPTWKKPLRTPTFWLCALTVILCLAVNWK